MTVPSRVKLVQYKSYPNRHKNFNDGNKVADLRSLLE
jgi:hypothetical protein